MIKAFVFDLDDTLYYERDFVYKAFENVASFLEGKYKIDKNKVFKEMTIILENEGRGKIFNRIIEKYKLEETVENLIEIYRDTIPYGIKLYEDAIETIEYLKGKKYKIGIITDGMSKVQWNKIKALDLENIVDGIVVSDDLGRENWKPSEIPYREMAKKLNIEVFEMVYVGDNPSKDFIGAKKIGIKTIQILREKGDYVDKIVSKKYKADIEISESLERLKKVHRNEKSIMYSTS